MEHMSNSEADELSRLLSVRDKKGRVAISIGFVSALYFETPWNKEKRQAVVDLTERYFDLCGKELKWVKHPKTGRMRPIAAGAVALPRDWLPAHDDPEEPWEFLFHGGEDGEEAGPFHVGGYGSDNITDGGTGLGSFYFSFPLLWFASKQFTFPELVRDWSSRLRALSGWGGLGIIESPDFIARKPFQKAVRTIAERFPGLEIEAPVTTYHVASGIKGVNWLTILGDRWIDKLGGRDYLRIRLDDSQFYFYPYEGGIVIQAGPKPQLGDVEANLWPQHYVTLAKVLKPVQITNHYPMHFGGTGGLDHQATVAWINRFDGK